MRSLPSARGSGISPAEPTRATAIPQVKLDAERADASSPHSNRGALNLEARPFPIHVEDRLKYQDPLNLNLESVRQDVIQVGPDTEGVKASAAF